MLTITDVFLDQKRVNVCEHAVKMAPRIQNLNYFKDINIIPAYAIHNSDLAVTFYEIKHRHIVL